MKDEETEPLGDGLGHNDEEPSDVLTPDLLSPESSARRDDTPLLHSRAQTPRVLEIAVESFDDNQSHSRQSNALQRICSKEGGLHVCGVASLLRMPPYLAMPWPGHSSDDVILFSKFLYCPALSMLRCQHIPKKACCAVCVLIVAFSWLGTKVSAVDNATESLAPPITAATSHVREIFATTSLVYSRLLFRYSTADDTSALGTSVRRLTVVSSVNVTLSPQDATESIMIRLPPDTYSTLKRLQVVGMDTDCALQGSMCLCEVGAVNSSTIPLELSSPYSDCVAECSYLLEPKPQAPAEVYDASDWYQLRVPCTMQPDRPYILEVLSEPNGAFPDSHPYQVSDSEPAANRRLQEDTGNSTGGAGDSAGHQWLEAAVASSPKRFEPSTLASGSATAFHRLVITAPAGVTVLSSAEEEHVVTNADGSREVTFRELQGWSPNMLAVAVGRFESLASGLDAQGRRVAVWAPPGGNPQDAELTLRVLNASVSAWSEFTGYSLPELEKLEMVVWNGGSPWSSSQFGLLFMDRFRTLWNADFSTASDLVRAVHITCHEAGHHWFGGVLQTLNHTKFFIEESTTSYAEVFCVSKVLPQVFGTVLSVERAVFPAFGDTRSIHVGAEFHAINNLATPEHAQDVVVSSSAAFYTKGAALLHMLESYADASVREGLMKQVIKDLFANFKHQAVTHDTLLCMLSLALAGCSPADLTGQASTCSAALASLIPLPTEQDDASEGAEGGSSSEADAAGRCGAAADRWVCRLRAWIVEPGIQQVELHVSSTGSVSTALQTYQAELLPNTLPAQADSQTPIWMPVGLLSSNVTATAWPGNTSAGILESRWLEIFPVWEEEHKVRVGGDETCGEAGDGDGDGAACGRPVASPPVVIDDGAPWLMKGSPGVFLGNISDSGAGKEHKAALVDTLRHLSLTVQNGSNLSEDDPELKLVLAFTSLIHDQRILFKTQPTADRYSFLRSLVVAAFQAKAASQAGLAGYFLLGAATSAVQDFFQLARGNEACFAALSDWEKDTISQRGTVLWPRAVHRSKQNIGFTEVTQDMLFSQIAAAHVVPRAVRYDTDLASSVCEQLPAEVPIPGQLEDTYKAMSHAPDIKNIVLETAIVASSACNGTGGMESTLLEYLQQSGKQSQLMTHLQRSLAFMLGSSRNTATLAWLMDTVVLGQDDSAPYGIREIDKYTLMKRIVRSSPAGFQLSTEILQKHAVNRTEDDWSDQEPLVQLAGIVSPAASESLPEWLPDSISEPVRQALQLEKDSDRQGSEIVCAR